MTPPFGCSVELRSIPICPEFLIRAYHTIREVNLGQDDVR